MKTFTNVNDQVLIQAISKATERIVFIAPGVSKRVAMALQDKIAEMQGRYVAIVLDVDPEVCRLGYGEVEGLECVRQAAAKWGITLDHQPGIRIGVLTTNDQTLIYAPTPQYIEAGSNTPEHPNAICLNSREVVTLEAACGSTGDCTKREVGLDPVRDSTVLEVKQELAINPPKRFDVSRAERVFNSALEYVEFHFTNFRLSQKEIPIPPELMGLADDVDLRARWKNGFRLFSDKQSFKVDLIIQDDNGNQQFESYTEHRLNQEKQNIVKDFLITIPNHGTFVLRNQKQRFVERIDQFKVLVESFKKAVDAEINEELERSKARLVEYLVPIVQKRIPSAWMSTRSPGDLGVAEAKERLNAKLARLFLRSGSVFAPEVKVEFKGITYETMKNKDFLIAAQQMFMDIGAESTFNNLFREYDAAPAVDNKY